MNSEMTHPQKTGEQATPISKPHVKPSIPPLIRPRDRRFITALVAGETSVHEMQRLVGARNIPALCMRLRRKGWLIETRKVPFVDRDGSKVQIGVYTLDPSQIPFALEMLAESWEGDE